jgi:predicted nucleic-acid-binding Zn-ribbon protein
MGLFSEEEPETATVLGKPFKCLVCHHDQFFERAAQFNTALATFFNMEWTGPWAMCIVCANCGYVHWFLI